MSANDPARESRIDSLWNEAAAPGPARPALRGEAHVDVAIVGAGYTGLWTAWALKRARPELEVALLEAERVGYGASARNGGWCTAEWSGSGSLLADPATRARALATSRAMMRAVDELGDAAAAEEIDCDYRKGGSVVVATCDAHARKLRSALAHARAHGFGEEDERWLGPDEVRERVGVPEPLGGLFTPHCASLHPAKLVHGLARALEARGVVIHEHARVRELTPGRAATAEGALRARVVLRCTEAYTARLAPRRFAPIHSLMVATAPLNAAQLEQVGLRHGETFADARRVVTYGQRTSDDRIAFGSRGDYFFGSRTRDRFPEAAFAPVEEILHELLPVLRGVPITHRWGGALALPRNWQPVVRFDPESGLGEAGGYVGNGVAAAHLAGRALAACVLDLDDPLRTLSWVDAPVRRWEPEPVRWLGVRGLRRLALSADHAEREGGRARLRGALVAAFFDD